jgi:hypothetical protein
VIVSGSDAALNSLTYNIAPSTVPSTQGTTFWDVDDNTLAVRLNGYILKIGEDQFYPVVNQTGNTITKGTAVGFAGTLGMSGKLLAAPYIANGSQSSTFFMGVTTEDILNGEDGKVLWFGRLRQINTNAYSEGDILYVSTTQAGAFQTTVPQAPNNIIQVAAVITKSATVGTIFVRPTFGSNIKKDESIKLTSIQNKQVLAYSSGSQLFENTTVNQLLEGTSITGSFTGSFAGDGSGITGVSTASFAFTASYIDAGLWD